jgi:hypothetical protein
MPTPPGFPSGVYLVQNRVVSLASPGYAVASCEVLKA